MADLTQLTPGTWNVDVSHSRVGFIARHLMISKVRGHFAEFSGVIEIAPSPLDSTVTATVNLASVATGDTNRDSHLTSGEFFDVEQHPTMTFTTTGIKDDDGDYTLFGDLTLRGVTRAVEFHLGFDGVSPDPWGGTRVGFTAETEINRKDFGLDFNVVLETGGVLVGEKVKIQLEIEAVKA